jgi:Protein of unknown function (DUF2865)
VHGQHDSDGRQRLSRIRQSRNRSRLIGIAVAIASSIATASAVAYYTQPSAPQARLEATPRKAAPASSQRAARRQTRVADVTDNWLRNLLEPGFWRGGGGDSGSRRESRPRERQPERQRLIPRTKEAPMRVIPQQGFSYASGTSYRTMCVRLCDGYYWPISFSVTKREFARDAAVCEKSCDAPVALHTYRNPGEEPENMVDLKGQPYRQLSKAFRYRVAYDASCKCRPHPWEQPSRQRHLTYVHQSNGPQ